MTPRSDVVMLVRGGPGSARARSALARAQALAGGGQPTRLVFFHGPAVALAVGDAAAPWSALADCDDTRLWVCAAAWRRRCRGAPASGFEVASLARFWQQALLCERLESHEPGPGPSPQRAPRSNRDSSGSFLIRVGIAPTAPDAEEVLELVMAGASLEIDLVVVFEGEGRRFLLRPWGRGWRQLVDFELATLYHYEDGAIDLPLSLAEPIEHQALNRLCVEREVVVV